MPKPLHFSRRVGVHSPDGTLIFWVHSEKAQAMLLTGQAKRRTGDASRAVRAIQLVPEHRDPYRPFRPPVNFKKNLLVSKSTSATNVPRAEARQIVFAGSLPAVSEDPENKSTQRVV